MKKKLLSLFIILGAFFSVLFSVKALTAKAPESIPATGTDVYGVVDSAFDYSKIKFTTSTGGTTNGKRDTLYYIGLGKLFGNHQGYGFP